jgi:hypothetical protein
MIRDDLPVESLRIKQSKQGSSVMYFKLLFAWGNGGNPRNTWVKIRRISLRFELSTFWLPQHYRPDGLGFDSRWCHLNFPFTRSFRRHYVPWVVPASSRIEYQKYFLRGKGGQCVRLTTLPALCADCLEFWEPQPPGTLRACPDLYRDCCTSTFWLQL